MGRTRTSDGRTDDFNIAVCLALSTVTVHAIPYLAESVARCTRRDMEVGDNEYW